jgi:hypothetical protein
VQNVLCHLNTALQPKASSPYACFIIWNISLADLPNFWQNLMFSHCSNCDIPYFHHSQTPTLHNSDFLNTPLICNWFLLGREKNRGSTMSWLHISAVVCNSATMWPVHKIIDCTTYCDMSTHCWIMQQSIAR